jgi:hypothetical protein
VEFVCRILDIGPSAIVDVTPALELGLFSTAQPDDLVARLLKAVDRHYQSTGFDELIIVAFSAGTVLARSLLAAAYGAVCEPDGELPQRPAHAWAPCVTRMVLLAGVTRGWELSSATPARIRFPARPLLWLLNLGARLLHPNRKGLFIQQIKRGAPFVIESRLKLLQVELASRKRGGLTLPRTVLLLGSKDEFVSPADAMDLGPSDYCSYIEVPHSSHMSIFDVAGASEHPDGHAAIRAELICSALVKGPHDLAQIEMRAEDIDDYADPMDRGIKCLSTMSQSGRQSVTESAAGDVTDGATGTDDEGSEQIDHVVFIIHGIRDNGFWTKRVAREIKAAGRDEGVAIRAPSPSYGFFSIWDFINPWGREEATYWFLERYAEAKRLWPGAKVSFVGHSNGTFLAARALTICPMVHFERVAFAGSVVRTDYRWANELTVEKGKPRCRRGRVTDKVLNIVATHDVVVSMLPGAFQQMGLYPLGIGGAGSAGFCCPPSGAAGPKVHNFRYVSGGHGAGVDEPMWHDLARFIVCGTLPKHCLEGERPSDRKAWQKALMLFSVWITFAVATAVIWVVQWFMTTGLSGSLLVLGTAVALVTVMSIVRYY